MIGRRLVALLLLAGLGAAPAAAADSCAPLAPEAEAKYPRLLAQAQDDPAGVDFGDLRIAYIFSGRFDPTGMDNWTPSRESLLLSIKDGRLAEAAAALDRIIAAHPLSLDAHTFARFVHDRLGNESRRAHHAEFGRRLFRAIADSGDGQTELTPFLVLSAGEEYAIINLLGLRPVRQSVIERKDRMIDRVEVRHGDDGPTASLYFDVTEAFTYMACALRGKQ